MSRTATTRGLRRGVAAAALGLVVTGCGSASDLSPPAGVDGLTVPTPSPEPDDFVDEIDNPWLPLAVGTSWSYTVTGGEPGEVRAVTVEEGPTVQGVTTTAVVTVATVPPGDVLSEETALYAQDVAGNVWWFGQEGTFEAGQDGAQAGIAMLASPRVGDGYRQARRGSVVDQRAEVVALDGEAETSTGFFEDLVVTETRTRPEAGRVLRSYYARDYGLVHRETLTGTPDETLDLAAYDEG